MLKLTNVDSYYDRSHILHAVCLDIPIGKVTTVLGRNGTGKTTLLKTLMGLTDRMDGQISLDGTEIGKDPTFRRARAGIAYVPQGREIIPDFSIRENILMGAFARADGKREIPELVPELFPYLIENLERAGGVLSGGQQQQLAIARALAANPKIILLDEISPCSMLLSLRLVDSQYLHPALLWAVFWIVRITPPCADAPFHR